MVDLSLCCQCADLCPRKDLGTHSGHIGPCSHDEIGTRMLLWVKFSIQLQLHHRGCASTNILHSLRPSPSSQGLSSLWLFFLSFCVVCTPTVWVHVRAAECWHCDGLTAVCRHPAPSLLELINSSHKTLIKATCVQTQVALIDILL